MDGTGILIKSGPETPRPLAKTPPETFGYRLTIENFRFTKVQRSNLSDGSHYIQDRGISVEIDDWTATINNNSEICVSYCPSDPDVLPYEQSYPLSDGVLFLLDCSKNQTTSFFQPTDYRPALRQHFGINQVYFSGANGIYDLSWNTSPYSSHKIANWLFSDGNIKFSPDVSSPHSSQLYHATCDNFSATVSDAKWAIVVSAEYDAGQPEDEEDAHVELSWNTQLYLDADANISSIVADLNRELNMLRQKDFAQILDGLI